MNLQRAKLVLAVALAIVACGGEKNAERVGADKPASPPKLEVGRAKAKSVHTPNVTGPIGDAAPGDGKARQARDGADTARVPDDAPVLAPEGSVAFIVLSSGESLRSERRLAKALVRGLRGKVTTLSSDSDGLAFGLAIVANDTATFPEAWKSYRHVVILQHSTATNTHDDTKYPGGAYFLGVFRTPSIVPLYLEQGGSLWPKGYEDVLPIINSLTKEATR